MPRYTSWYIFLRTCVLPEKCIYTGPWYIYRLKFPLKCLCCFLVFLEKILYISSILLVLPCKSECHQIG